MQQPRHQHDCDICTFLGQYKNYDLYFCPQMGHPTVIARWSDEGPDYTSGMVFATNGTSKSLVEALKIANEMGLHTMPLSEFALCEHERLNDHGDACIDCGAVYIDGRWQ